MKIRINNYKEGPISVLNFPHHAASTPSPHPLRRHHHPLPNLQPCRLSQLRVRLRQTLPRRAPPQVLSRQPPQRIALPHRYTLGYRRPTAHNPRRHQHRAPQQQQLRPIRPRWIHPAQFPPTRSIPQIDLRQLPPRIAALHFTQHHRRIRRCHFRSHSQHARSGLTRRTRHDRCPAPDRSARRHSFFHPTRRTRHHTQRPRRKRRQAPPRRTSPRTSRCTRFRLRLHQHLRHRHCCFRQLHRKLRTISLFGRARRFPLRFLFSVAPRHFSQRFFARRTLAVSLRLLLFLLCWIIFPRRNFGLIFRREDLRALQIVFGINMVGILRLRGLPRLFLPRRFRRILRVQTIRTYQPGQQKSHYAEEERSSTFFQGTRDRCVQPHRLALARVVLHIHRGDRTGLLGEIVPRFPRSWQQDFFRSVTAPHRGLPLVSALSPLSRPILCPVAQAFRLEAFPRTFPVLVYGTLTPACPERSRRDRSGPIFLSRRLLARRAAQWRNRGAPLFSPFFLLASLCELCVPISVISVLPSLFSANSATSASPRPELRGAHYLFLAS